MRKGTTGLCYCGAVQYQITRPIALVVNCHCQACRARTGAAYSTYAVVAQQALNITQGAECIGAYEVAGEGTKHFCVRCGTPLYNQNARYPGRLMVYYGTLATHAGLTPAVNIYCESKLPWVDAVASFKSFDQAMGA